MRLLVRTARKKDQHEMKKIYKKETINSGEQTDPYQVALKNVNCRLRSLNIKLKVYKFYLKDDIK